MWTESPQYPGRSQRWVEIERMPMSAGELHMMTTTDGAPAGTSAVGRRRA
jgi:hypothetical protein